MRRDPTAALTVDGGSQIWSLLPTWHLKLRRTLLPRCGTEECWVIYFRRRLHLYKQTNFIIDSKFELILVFLSLPICQLTLLSVLFLLWTNYLHIYITRKIIFHRRMKKKQTVDLVLLYCPSFFGFRSWCLIFFIPDLPPSLSHTYTQKQNTSGLLWWDIQWIPNLLVNGFHVLRGGHVLSSRSVRAVIKQTCTVATRRGALVNCRLLTCWKQA